MYLCHLKMPQPVCLQIPLVNLTRYICGPSRECRGRKEAVWGCCLHLIRVCLVMIWVRMKRKRDNSIFACFKTDVSKRWVLTVEQQRKHKLQKRPFQFFLKIYAHNRPTPTREITNKFGFLMSPSWEIKPLEGALAQNVNTTATLLALCARCFVLQHLI